MAAYNKVNGDYAAANDVLINDVLKGAWGYRGWVMSDWGAHPRAGNARLPASTRSAARRSTRCLWQAEAFADPLRAAYADGRLPKERLSDMVRRILRSIFAVGIDRWEPARRRIWTRTTRLPARSHVRGSCSCPTGGCCRWRQRRGRPHRRHRRLCRARGAGRLRFQRGRCRRAATRT